jgi:hypothetical protein
MLAAFQLLRIVIRDDGAVLWCRGERRMRHRLRRVEMAADDKTIATELPLMVTFQMV